MRPSLAVMRVSAVLLALGALIGAAVAGAASLDKARGEPALVTARDMTQQAVASASAWSPKHCEAVDLWSPDVGAAYRFHAPGACPATSTGRGIAAVATDYNRVLWLAYAGGNTREYTLWTATRTAKQPRRLRFASADVDAPAPIVLGNGGESEIPYAVGVDVVVLGYNGKRLISWHAPARVVALSAGPGGVGVLVETGHLYILKGAAPTVTDYAYAPGEVKSFRTSSIGTIVNTPGDIEIRTGTKTVPLGIGPGAFLVGFADGNVVYTRGAEIRLFYRPTGDDTLVRRVRQPFRAEFDRRGLAWATRNTVCFSVRVYFAHPLERTPACG